MPSIDDNLTLVLFRLLVFVATHNAFGPDPFHEPLCPPPSPSFPPCLDLASLPLPDPERGWA